MGVVDLEMSLTVGRLLYFGEGKTVIINQFQFSSVPEVDCPSLNIGLPH